MTFRKSLHSAPHSIVQAAFATQLQKLDAAQGTSRGEDRMQQVTAILETLPHPRHRLQSAPIATHPLGAGGPLSAECIEIMLKYAWAAIRKDQGEMARLKDDFEKSSCGAIGWLGAAAAYLFKDLEPLTYRQAPSPPDDTTYCYALPEQDAFRIGILGDWGTGETVAQDVINAMLAMDVDFMIHVGDVYYAGTDDEVKSNYLDMIATARATAVPSRNINVPIYNLAGNHDYYYKGKPFYDALSSVNAGTAFPNSPTTTVPEQEASFFVLRNSWLQLQAMDTGYYDSDLFAVANDTTQLNENEAAWHLYQLNQAKANGRSVVLFSHHQPWSRFLGIGNGPGTAGGLARNAMPMLSFNKNLQAQLATAPKDVVLAWLWGHEHVLEVYDQPAIAASTVPIAFLPLHPLLWPLVELFPWVPYGACVGFSAFPMLETDQPYEVAEPGLKCNETYQLGLTTTDGVPVYDHGFTVLDVKKNASGKPSTTATYYSLPADGSSKIPTAFTPSVIA